MCVCAYTCWRRYEPTLGAKTVFFVLSAFHAACTKFDKNEKNFTIIIELPLRTTRHSLFTRWLLVSAQPAVSRRTIAKFVWFSFANGGHRQRRD